MESGEANTKKKIYILGKINIETKQWKNYKITKTFRNFKVNNILDHSNRDRGAGYKSGPNKPLKIIFYKQLGGILAISLIGNYKIKDARIISNYSDFSLSDFQYKFPTLSKYFWTILDDFMRCLLVLTCKKNINVNQSIVNRIR